MDSVIKNVGGVGCRGALGGFNHIQTRDTLQGF